jgi:hypothetical protein
VVSCGFGAFALEADFLVVMGFGEDMVGLGCAVVGGRSGRGLCVQLGGIVKVAVKLLVCGVCWRVIDMTS